MNKSRFDRRNFLRGSAQIGGLVGLNSLTGASLASQSSVSAPDNDVSADGATFIGDRLNHVAFPLGGLGAGMICVEGTGTLSNFSLHHRPQLNNEPRIFAAVALGGKKSSARVLEGPVPTRKLNPRYSGDGLGSLALDCWGLPRFSEASFEAHFPFATVRLVDNSMPLVIELVAWSPFTPGDADNSSLPLAVLEYGLINRTRVAIEGVFSFNSENFMGRAQHGNGAIRTDSIQSTGGGFVLCEAGTTQHPTDEGYFAAWTDDPQALVNCAWFPSYFGPEPFAMAWDDIQNARCYRRGPLQHGGGSGATIFVPFKLRPSEHKTVVINLAWYVPHSSLVEPSANGLTGKPIVIPPDQPPYRPWYAERFAGMEEIKKYWDHEHKSIRRATEIFTQTFYDSTLPQEVLDSIAANLTILKSPTILRQADGRLWGWEGCENEDGCCYGSANHVWNYAQALAHLFPQLERTLRETEFVENLGHDGFQAIRAALPIRPIGDSKDARTALSAADGQLGSVIKVYREWRISGDATWLRGIWPKVRLCLDYCIETWDPRRRGLIEESHLTTFDVCFWGADSMCSSIYLGALRAATEMGKALNEPVDVYTDLLARGIRNVEETLFNGEFFIQKTQWRDLRTAFRSETMGAEADSGYPSSSEFRQLGKIEGPPYQYGPGCLSDGVLGSWLCLVSGLDETLDVQKIHSHLAAVYRYNFKRDLTEQVSLLRPFFAFGSEAGLVVCTWPRGGRPTLPCPFVDEVWTGSEYQVASHLIATGRVSEGLELVRATRKRYDGRIRNPFAEIEAGYWYARAMSSYALLFSISGARFDAVEKTLYLKPAIRGDFRSFLSTATGYGIVGVRNGLPFVEVKWGTIPYERIDYRAI